MTGNDGRENGTAASAAASAGAALHRNLHAGALALSATGAAIMGYLSYLHFGVGGSVVCDLSETLNCSVVNQSIFSEIIGIPVSFLGLAYFLTLIVILLSRRVRNPYTLVLLFSAFSLTFGLYLTGIELLVIKSFCLFCELSKVVMLAVIVVSAVAARHAKETVSSALVVAAIVAGLVFAAAAYRVQRVPFAAPDWTAEAQCLTERGVVMYGAYWCPKCAKQKRLFGDAVEFISEVECDPRGENAEPERCVAREISGTPTWIQETPDGEVVERLAGVHAPDVLAERFGCLSSD